MSTIAFEHPLPWSEEEYLALGETPDRIELFDGSLLVSPAPTFRHQRISQRLVGLLEPAANAAGLEVFEAVNVRLRPGRIPIPDLVLIRPIDLDEVVADAELVELICEIISPSNVATDKLLKMHHYAEAGIPWYLLVDPQLVTLLLFRLDGSKYVLHAEGGSRRPLHLDAPVVVDIDPAVLLR